MPGRPITTWEMYLLLAAFVVAIGIGNRILKRAEHYGWRNLGALFMRTIRQRAALVICVGLGLLAADWFIGGDIFSTRHYWYDAHRAGYLSLIATVMALIGVYHWISNPPP